MEGVMMRTQVKSQTMKMKWTLGRIGRMQKKKRNENKENVYLRQAWAMDLRRAFLNSKSNTT
eukprot:1905071-Ditylum_brightwellii.AAC.1